MEKQTFKQYLESKEQLLKAIENTPISIVEYEVRKYCTLIVNDTNSISLKPKNKIVVEWQYNDIDNPTPLYIRIKGVREINETEQYNITIPRIKLQKFLSRYTTTLPNKGY